MSTTDYSCMFLIDSKLYNKKILQPDSDTSLNNHYQTHSVFQGDPNPIIQNPIMSQPQIIIKNDLKQKKANENINKADLLKNISTPSEKIETNDEDSDMIDLTDKSNTNICFNCSEREKNTEDKNNANIMIDKEEIPQQLSENTNSDKLMKDLKTNKEHHKDQIMEHIEKSTIESDEENDEQEWIELKERLRRLREDYPDVDINAHKQSKVRGDKAEPNAVQLTAKEENSEANADQVRKTKKRKVSKNAEKDSISSPSVFNNKNIAQVIPSSVQINTSGKRLKSTHSKTRPKLNHSERKPELQSDIKNIVFLCGICNQKFVRLKSLERHMKNIHSDYNYKYNQENKRKRNDPYLTDKKFIHDGRVKRKNRTKDAGHYEKRQKLPPQKQVIYQNYFE